MNPRLNFLHNAAAALYKQYYWIAGSVLNQKLSSVIVADRIAWKVKVFFMIDDR